ASPLAEGEYYMEDLIGCSVFESGKFLGKLEDIIETGANDVYSVMDKSGRELLIPALKNVILDVDIEKKSMEVILPEGLVDDEYI
ncbi:MAG: ribosome maturation factor RimM, partial [Clostridia bacterium]|nr:ribosome maturation factor RimM [Clostridia bacterium]